MRPSRLHATHKNRDASGRNSNRDFPDNVNASTLSLVVSASGLVRTKTTPLLTVEDTDMAPAKSANYRTPGR
jgi:hypothetical protein